MKLIKVMKKKYSIIFVLLFISVVLIYGFFQERKLAVNHLITKATITSVRKPGYRQSGDYTYYYMYFVNGKKYTDGKDGNFCGNQTLFSIRSLLVNKCFPVVYSVANPRWNDLILTSIKAEEFNYQLPDSLKIYDSILTCKKH